MHGEAGGSANMFSVIAIVAIIALVVVLLAFFFRADITQREVMIGLPHDKEAPGVTFTQLGAPERLNTTPRTETPKPEAISESRLP